MTRVRRGATCNCYTLWHTQVVEKIMKVYWFWITHSLKNSNTNKLNSPHLNSFLNLTYKSFKENYDLRPFDCYHYVELFKNNFLIFIWSLISSHVILSESNQIVFIVLEVMVTLNWLDFLTFLNSTILNVWYFYSNGSYGVYNMV